MSTALVIHGHFYQPPRENPWTGLVDREPSAHPFHDWNERIAHECYRANAFARVLDGWGRVDKLLDNYRYLSFNFGPTLLSWLAAHDPATYDRILEADRESVRLHGNGNAIAQAYNHAILPLCNDRDRVTQVRWGLADFAYRFGRPAEALWLPETACNDATLGTLIDHGMRYVILSPHQAERVRPLGDGEWRNVADGGVDPGVPYRYVHRDGSGRSLAIFFYDGPLARAIAFEGALTSSETFLDLLGRAPGGDGRLVHVATDGESYGHHTKFGERTIAYALAVEAPRRDFEVTNYAAFLARTPPAMEVEIKAGPNGEGTAWSCAHGVGRWYRDCGCQTGGGEGWTQGWRTPLRDALDLLRDAGARAYEDAVAELLPDPWAARDAYIDLVLDRDRSREEWLARHAGRALGERERVRALTALEMQRNALLMYTSCGWFFTEISGIETVQVLKYAGRVLDLLEELGQPSPRDRFLEVLAAARSNLPDMGSGADVFQRFVEPLRVSPGRIAAHLAISSLVDDSDNRGEKVGYAFVRSHFRKQQHGRVLLATGRLQMEERTTGRRFDWAVAALHLGGVDFYCVLKRFPGVRRFQTSVTRLWSSFRTASLPAMLRLAQEELGSEEYGLESVLPEERQKIASLVFGDLVSQFADNYLHLYESNQRLLDMLHEAGFELPAELQAAAEFTFGRRFEQEILHVRGSHDPKHYARAIALADEVAHRRYRINRDVANRLFETMIEDAVSAALADPSAEKLRLPLAIVQLARRLHLDLTLDRAQERLYAGLARDGLPQDAARELALAIGFAPSAVAMLAAAPAGAMPAGEAPAADPAAGAATGGAAVDGAAADGAATDGK